MQLSQNKSQKSAYLGSLSNMQKSAGQVLVCCSFLFFKKEDLNTVNIYKNVQRS